MFKTRLALGVLALSAVSVAAVRPILFQEPQLPEVTDHHKMLLKGVGEWEGTLTMNMPGMEEPVPVQESVTAVGDYWTTSKFTGNFGGMPFHGTGVTGYDATKKQFVGTWVDNMTSHLSIMNGSYDAKTSKLTMNWEAPDQATGAMAVHRMETIHRSDAVVSHFFMGEGDAAVETMVIKMKRKSKAMDASASDKK